MSLTSSKELRRDEQKYFDEETVYLSLGEKKFFSSKPVREGVEREGGRRKEGGRGGRKRKQTNKQKRREQTKKREKKGRREGRREGASG